MTFKELVEYAKKVGVPDRAFKEAFAPLIARENKVLDDLEALVAMAECDRQAEYWKKVEKIIIRNRAERKERMKEKRRTSMNVTFLFSAVCGKGDSTDWEADVEITEEEYQRIEDACREGLEFRDSEDVEDIYNKLLEIASEGLDDDSYAIVYYPKGMEERIWDEDELDEDEDEE